MFRLSWIDYDDAERRRMHDLIRLFSQPEARDELGMGVIRDSFADLFFPGTSTIQTRVKYFLFVAWIYRALESKGLSAREFRLQADRQERALIKPLLDNSPDKYGVFGKMSRDVIRLPSSVYWRGLSEWGIRKFNGSQEEYFDHTIVQKKHSTRIREDEDDSAPPTCWDPGLPPAPEDMLNTATLALTEDEARYLRDCIKRSQPKSVLSRLLDFGPVDDGITFVWEHPGMGELDKELQEYVEHARLFSTVIHGAAITYNLYLAELVKRDGIEAGEDWHDSYLEKLAQWAAAIEAERDKYRDWRLDRFWEIVEKKTSGNSSQARVFMSIWVDMVKKNITNLSLISELPEIRKLVFDRELALKGKKARVASMQSRKQWAGDTGSGMGRYEYRWSIARNFINELTTGGTRDV